MQDLAHWLEALGMSEYAQRFAENDIDVEVLSELTDKDFDRLGVSLGHRRKMLRAIREVAASPVPAVTERTVSAAPTSSPKGHRRAPPSHRDALGPCRLYSTLGAYGP